MSKLQCGRFAGSLSAFAADERGATAVEYALLCAIALAIFTAVTAVGANVLGLFTRVDNAIPQ